MCSVTSFVTSLFGPPYQIIMDESDLSEQFQKQLRGMLVCLKCGPLHRFPSGKTHKSRTKHDMRAMTPEERAAEISWYREIQADGEDARLRLLEQRRRASRSARPQPSESEAVMEYRFDFGKHKGKTVLTVWRDHKSYFAFVINCKMLDDKLSLKRAMEDNGIMAPAETLAAELRAASAFRTLARVEEEIHY